MTLATLNDYDRINIDPTFWGEEGWDFLFASVIGYPKHPNEEEMMDAERLILCLKSMLACMKCRKNYNDHLEKILKNNNIYSSREELLKFLIDIKNEVNKSTGKSTYNYDDTINYYYKKIFKKYTPKTTTYTLILLIAVLLFIVYIVIKH